MAVSFYNLAFPTMKRYQFISYNTYLPKLMSYLIFGQIKSGLQTKCKTKCLSFAFGPTFQWKSIGWNSSFLERMSTNSWMQKDTKYKTSPVLWLKAAKIKSLLFTRLELVTFSNFSREKIRPFFAHRTPLCFLRIPKKGSATYSCCSKKPRWRYIFLFPCLSVSWGYYSRGLGETAKLLTQQKVIPAMRWDNHPTERQRDRKRTL